MNRHSDANVVTMNGDPVYHHAQATPWSPAQGEICIQQISDHIETHLGPVATVYHEILSDTVHIDVHIVPPTDDFPFVRLVTSGMSDLPMHTPEEIVVPRHVEVMMTLPPDWKLDQTSLNDENWYWPIRLIKYLARLPHKHQTWLGFGHTVPNGNPAEPYASAVQFDGCILLPSVTAPQEFHALRIDETKEIVFYAVVPLYKDEMDLKIRSGTNKLLERFDKKDVSDVVDPHRVNTARKRFGFF